MSYYKKLRLHTVNYLHNPENKPLKSKKVNKDYSKGYYLASSNIIDGRSSIDYRKREVERVKKKLHSKNPEESNFSKGFLAALKDFSKVNIVASEKKWMSNQKWNELNVFRKRVNKHEKSQKRMSSKGLYHLRKEI